MNNYISVNGKALGPIQLGNNGTWLVDKIIYLHDEYGKELKTKHLTFSLDRERDELVVLRGKTPPLGTYTKDGIQYPCYDPRSLVTAEWVMGYCSNMGQGSPINLNLYATHDDLRKLELKINQGGSVSDVDFKEIQDTVDSHSKAIYELQNSFNELSWPTEVYINCGKASPNWTIE